MSFTRTNWIHVGGTREPPTTISRVFWPRGTGKTTLQTVLPSPSATRRGSASQPIRTRGARLTEADRPSDAASSHFSPPRPIDVGREKFQFLQSCWVSQLAGSKSKWRVMDGEGRRQPDSLHRTLPDSPYPPLVPPCPCPSNS